MLLFPFRQLVFTTMAICSVVLMPAAQGADFVHVVSTAKSSVVAIAAMDKIRTPPLSFVGTGFAVGDGLTIATNAHVVRALVAAQLDQSMGIAIIKDNATEFRRATVLRIDAEHDLALLRIEGSALPAMALGDAGAVREGQSVAFSGFPLGTLIGLRHVTHRAMVSSITPIVIAAPDANKLDGKTIAQLRKSSFDVFQLDGTAYPGNSGSPVYDVDTGAAVGVINMVYVKGLKENAVTNPSGIAYAIPINFVRDLLARRP